MPDRDRSEVLLKQRKVLADFGDVALQSEDLNAVLQEACRLVGEALGTGRAKVLEIEEGGQSLFVRAGVGWASDVVGHVHLPMEEHSSETFAIKLGEPVITQDISKEDRFDVPPFMKEAGVVALVNVPVFRPGRRAYGLLQVDDTQARDFDQGDIEFLRTYATILGPVIDRLLKLTELRSSEERFRAIVETATDYAIFTTDTDGRIVIWPKGAQEIFGWTAEEAVGQPMEMTYTPEDRAEGVPAKERQEAREKGHAPNVRWHVRKDGSRVFIDGVARPLTGPDGTETGFVKVGQDVTERRATEEALRESEERFQQFGEASSDVLWIRDSESLAYEYLSPAYEQVYGLPREEALRGNHVYRWMELIHPEDRERVLDLLRRVRAGENATETYRVIRPSDGQTRWIRNTDFPLRDADGRVQRIGGLSHDTTEEVETRERLQVLVTELQHRTRNLIGVVNSIANQTMAHTGPTEAFREEFSHRMAALSRVQGLLSRSQEEPITLRALLTLELDALGAKEGEHVRIDGPWVRIRPTIVQTVALVVHELATNARKYGALSEGGGRLSVEWRLREVEGERRAFIDWREEDLSPTEADQFAAERGGGYGRRLIERALPYSLGATTTYELGSTELRCTIDLPLDRAPVAR
ncbi:PAS domain S-box protein [Rubellimicrobium roseum]|uniref:histidine kinase n=1 Tax=Rubellimicrobium roseum TaxID=687525 RepID=A0A5C4N360_9RHOB|nr:PAS domain S-box protein [Rubellimicrobium roseum]TNC59359.1 PAS domain S-box protein [Rubellimicrobium roseum]